MYETVIVRNSDPGFEQPVFEIYPDLKEYSTKDLFPPHPNLTKGSLWAYLARRRYFPQEIYHENKSPYRTERYYRIVNGIKKKLGRKKEVYNYSRFPKAPARNPKGAIHGAKAMELYAKEMENL
ncbi:d4ba22f5-ae54-4ba4-bf33-4d655615b5dd [Sclerotinia trifoliorum]|uniref:D4ba22f5-ae54-4ba4-bf33-4d655615b5dd n=1 Tax=Sclerotinia trifoliorum TaxID=28548 RepID=A0A8H2ZW95_9HELO|nr:d4ba22f5-ae54-4ba4-bf33-4d655615b5dd [Sclerotinia trifoliorum]